MNNSVAILLTETHLHSDNEENEIYINGWSLFRGDRLNRMCGGSIIYIKDGLTVANETSFSNEFCDMAAVFISNRNVALISVYWSPVCPINKLMEII